MDNRALLLGAGIGAALTFAFDPAAGRRRRALVRDKVVRSSHVTGRAVGRATADVTNRTRGIIAATRRRVRPGHADDDVTVIERVRAKLGRTCTHPHAIEVEAADGTVTLRGPILEDEVKDVLAEAARVRGVRSVMNALEPHASAAGIPSLQGRARTPGPSLDVLHRRWAPGTKAMVGLTAIAAGGVALAVANR
jgi:hypothetical protein